MEDFWCDKPCSCLPALAIPLCKIFHDNVPSKKAVKLPDVKQRECKAEMSQVDWLVHYATKLKSGEAVDSIVTSADIRGVFVKNCLF